MNIHTNTTKYVKIPKKSEIDIYLAQLTAEIFKKPPMSLISRNRYCGFKRPVLGSSATSAQQLNFSTKSKSLPKKENKGIDLQMQQLVLKRKKGQLGILASLTKLFGKQKWPQVRIEMFGGQPEMLFDYDQAVIAFTKYITERGVSKELSIDLINIAIVIRSNQKSKAESKSSFEE